MPYKNREQHRVYMRNYRKLKRAQKRLPKLKQKYARLLEAFRQDAAAAYLGRDYSYDLQCEIKEYEEKIEHLKGLLPSPSNLRSSGGVGGKPVNPDYYIQED